MKSIPYQMGDALRVMVEKEASRLFKKIQYKPIGTEIIGEHVYVKKIYENCYDWKVI